MTIQVYMISFCLYIQYAQETQHEKILRGLSLGIALVSCTRCFVHILDVQCISTPVLFNDFKGPTHSG